MIFFYATQVASINMVLLDVTRTICFTKPKLGIKNIYTKVLKGHIAVANTDLRLDNNGR